MSAHTFERRGGERLTVGVSIFVRQGAQSLWENGIFQNCLFLAMLLTQVPRIAEVVLVAGGDGTREDARRFLSDAPVPVIDMHEALDRLDLMIEMSAQLDSSWSAVFRERGGRIVTMRVGNDYVIDSERMVFDKPHGLLISGAHYDEIWTLPQYEKSAAPYYRSAMRAEVRIVPHLWSPLFVENEVAALSETGQSFGYRPGRRRWRAGIFEPNICMVKTGFIPLLCCEAAHRVAPDLLEHVWAYNTFHLKEQPAFNGFAKDLDIVRHGLTSFEARFPFVETMANQVDVVVAHQWENAQNYVYYEALYGAYPLIHNAGRLGGCGYRYDDFDCEQGGEALRAAFATHDADLASYRRTAQAFLQGLSPESEINVRFYAGAIDAVCASAAP
ncbi:MAG TPA: DUF2827 domain-containing protein [Paraburkholderia sp.]|jgi:hypothetical protein|nr:DUF2827 domain-containing protein [Paraburkholderia sp.]